MLRYRGWQKYTGFGDKVLHVALLYPSVGQINLEPQTIPGTRLQIADHGLRMRIPLGDFERARVLLAAVALVNRSINIHVFVLRIRHPGPSYFHVRRFDRLDFHFHVKRVRIRFHRGGHLNL